MSRILSVVAGAVLFVSSSAFAQENETVITLYAGPSFVDFGRFGGSFGAAVFQLSVSRQINGSAGVELSNFMLAPLGGSSTIAGCPANANCVDISTPNALAGTFGSVVLYFGESGLGATLGGGAVKAIGGSGFENRSSIAGLVGLNYAPRTSQWFVPTFVLRVAHLSEPIAGARQVFLPGVGLRF